ncbi:uncharacterized protein LOC129950172 [Eupeodes corollae]|uniref:uncharacterized protein LOC129950172 n=1 Tax=Eupeodes corollae TaxID=290404 RepID=UPI00249383A0|nr:uncharacterized protein LOC129950172 [Eupeodes corollae]
MSKSTITEDFDEYLDAEFHSDIKSAKTILKTFKRPKDREIALSLIERVQLLNSNSLEVKSNRNKFTRYFLKVLQKNSDTQPKEYDIWFKPRETKEPTENALWSPDRRTFIATKTIPGFGMLVYMAVTHEPELGWQDYGFLSYDFMN